MNYWHIQMNQPHGRGKGTIDSAKLLENNPPLIATGEWEDQQCLNFKGNTNGSLQVGDVVMVREGKNPIALVQVVGQTFNDLDLTQKFEHDLYREVEVLGWMNDELERNLKRLVQEYKSSNIQYQGTLNSSKPGNATGDFIRYWHSQVARKRIDVEILDGIYEAAIPLAKDDWTKFLQMPGSEEYYDLLMKIYQCESHSATCSLLSKKFGGHPTYYVSKLTQLTKKMHAHINAFDVYGTDGRLTFYPIAMRGRYIENNHFEWIMRKEIISAVEELNLIATYQPKNENDIMIQEAINLLNYKKQIILQGPPGTGKTRAALELATKLVILTPTIVANVVKVGSKIPNASGVKEYYTVKASSGQEVTLISDRTTQDWNAPFSEIKEKYEQLVNGETPINQNGTHPYSLAVAKYLFSLSTDELFADQIKLVQFHPSFTYEDFVRGIVAKPNPDGVGVVYEVEDKILAKIAETARKNHESATSNDEIVSVLDRFEIFKDFVEEQIEMLGKFQLSDNVYIFYADDKRFKYKGDNWTAHPNGLNMNFDQLKKILSLNLRTRAEIKKQPGLSSLTSSHATYFQSIIEKYHAFILNSPQQSKSNHTLQNYVLIIDEINRANLSSVLGELIYALEYRGKEVTSMYGEEPLILPPNLYIIGTMNTADRSVGHIDYAIRRRFAFVDVLPEVLSDDKDIVFASELFDRVAKLFDTNLGSDFKKEDVQLGHSYFIDKSEEGGSMDVRWQYEILPILKEYIKDGILVNITEDEVKALFKVEQDENPA